jgi:hypothetical protein
LPIEFIPVGFNVHSKPESLKITEIVTHSNPPPLFFTSLFGILW